MAKKICYVCEATAGGVRKHLRQLLNHFAQPAEGFEVHALLGDRGEPGFQAEVAELRKLGVNVQMVDSFMRNLNPAADLAAYQFIKRRLQKIVPEIVHTHSSKAGFLGRLAAHACRVRRIIHTPHIFPFQWARGLSRAFYLDLERFAAKRCHTIVCVARGQQEEAIRRRVAPPGKFLLIRNGVDLSPAPSPGTRVALRTQIGVLPDAPVVGMVARLARQKGVGMFLDAAARVVKRLPMAFFVVVGSGPEEAEIRGRAAKLGLGAGRLKMLGHVENAERLYPAFDVLALTSLYEGSPYVLLEAMASGVPVVATDVLGSNEIIIDGKSGMLAPPNDPQKMSDILYFLLTNPPLRAHLAADARGRVQRTFPVEYFLDAHRKLYWGSLKA